MLSYLQNRGTHTANKPEVLWLNKLKWIFSILVSKMNHREIHFSVFFFFLFFLPLWSKLSLAYKPEVLWLNKLNWIFSILVGKMNHREIHLSVFFFFFFFLATMVQAQLSKLQLWANAYCEEDCNAISTSP